jgi:ABC-type amino acid transport substrate-binding protein
VKEERRRVLLVIEDGTEYTDAFTRLAPGGENVELLAAADAATARRLLAERRVDAVFLDLDFSRTPRERLLPGGAGDQGFRIASALAPLLPPGVPVVIAHDFTTEPERLEALRERVPGLEGVVDGTPISRVLERLTAA